jgi:hypothetical protein
LLTKNERGEKDKKYFEQLFSGLQWRLTCRRMRIDSFLSSYTKFKSKWIKELHIKPKILNLFEEQVGKTLEVMGTGQKFLNRKAMACAVRLRMINGT